MAAAKKGKQAGTATPGQTELITIAKQYASSREQLRLRFEVLCSKLDNLLQVVHDMSPNEMSEDLDDLADELQDVVDDLTEES
jgi:inorganic triphosphatase YgiF